MIDEKIQLWTIHRPGFSITEGNVDHSKSEYYLDTPGVRDAYLELWRRLHTEDGQVLWCFTKEDDIRVTGEEKIKWELHVPVSAVISFIDDIVWNRILGIKCCVRSDMHRQWHKEALFKCPYDSKASRDYEKECFDRFWKEKPRFDSWWDELFIDNSGEGVSAIIKHPVPIQWVSRRISICCR